MTDRVIAALALVVLGAVCVAPKASAQQEGSAADREARAIFSAGTVAFEDGRYDSALARFEEAYALSGRPELLYNIGLCLDRLRRDAEALAAFERFLAAVPDPPYRDEVEHRIAALRTAVAAPPPREEVAVGAPTDVPVSPGPGSGDVTSEWWFWTLIGVGLVAAVAVPVSIVLTTGGTTMSDPVTGDFGPGGVVVALEVRP